MDIGLALPQFDFSVPGEQPLRWRTVLHWAAKAEALGFGSVWVADHLFFSIEKYGGPPGEHGVYDPIVVLGALALNDGKLGGTVQAQAGVTVNPNFDGGPGTLNITGAATRTITFTGGSTFNSTCTGTGTKEINNTNGTLVM